MTPKKTRIMKKQRYELPCDYLYSDACADLLGVTPERADLILAGEAKSPIYDQEWLAKNWSWIVTFLHWMKEHDGERAREWTKRHYPSRKA